MLRTKSLAVGCSLLVLAACAQPGGTPASGGSATESKGLTGQTSQAVSPVNDESLPLVARALAAKNALTKAYAEELMTDEDALNIYRLGGDAALASLGATAAYYGNKMSQAPKLQLKLAALSEQGEIIKASIYFRENLAKMGETMYKNVPFLKVVESANTLKAAPGLYTVEQVAAGLLDAHGGPFHQGYFHHPAENVAKITEQINKTLVDSVSPSLLRRMTSAVKSKEGARALVESIPAPVRSGVASAVKSVKNPKALGSYAIASGVGAYHTVAGGTSALAKTAAELGRTSYAAAAERASFTYFKDRVASLGTKEGLKAVAIPPVNFIRGTVVSGYSAGRSAAQTVKKYAGNDISDSAKLIRSRALMSVGLAVLGYSIYDAISELNDNHAFGGPDYVAFKQDELMTPEMRPNVLRMSQDEFLTVAGKKGNEAFAQYMIDWFNAEANPAVLPASIQ